MHVQQLTVESYVETTAATACVVRHRGQAIAGSALVGNNTLSLPTHARPREAFAHGDLALQCRPGIIAVDHSSNADLKFKLISRDGGTAAADASWSTLLLSVLLVPLTLGFIWSTRCGTEPLAGAIGTAYLRIVDRSAQSQDYIKRRRKWLLKHSEPEDTCAALLMGDLQEALLASPAVDQQPASWMVQADGPSTDSTARPPSRVHRLLIQKIAGEFSANLIRQVVTAQCDTSVGHRGSTADALATQEEFMRARHSLRGHIDCRCKAVKVSGREAMAAAAILRRILAASPGCSSADA